MAVTATHDVQESKGKYKILQEFEKYQMAPLGGRVIGGLNCLTLQMSDLQVLSLKRRPLCSLGGVSIASKDVIGGQSIGVKATGTY